MSFEQDQDGQVADQTTGNTVKPCQSKPNGIFREKFYLYGGVIGLLLPALAGIALLVQIKVGQLINPLGPDEAFCGMTTLGAMFLIAISPGVCILGLLAGWICGLVVDGIKNRRDSEYNEFIDESAS